MFRRRFIPTRVGNTSPARGNVLVPAAGSSPHAWGTRILSGSARGRICSRFIPTRVGNTRLRPSFALSRPRPAVHPHTRGEHAIACLFEADDPAPVHPHTRGEHTDRATLDGSPHAVDRWLVTVHPHTRGEHRSSTRTEIEPSVTVHPHTRGEHDTFRRRDDGAWGTRGPGSRIRFIPTRVGNTMKPPRGFADW